MTKNNRILVSLVLGALPLTMMAQDDDMYFVPTKKTVERTQAAFGTPRSTYYSGSDRSVDEYNRRGMGGSYYQVVPTDSTASDVIDFSAERGVYPDSMQTEDFALTRQMSRYDGYEPDLAYRAGYDDGRRDSWAWHSPWYYSSYYPWYDSWYDPWYGYHGWYSSWYDPWYYDYYWHRPYGWYGGYYGYYRPYYYGGGYWHGGGSRGVYARTGNTGTIDRRGYSHGSFGRSTSSRAGSASSRATTYNRTSGNFSRSSSGSYSRSSSSSSGNFSRSSSSSSGNFSRSSSSSSGSFSRSSGGGGSFSGGGGGSRGGGGFGRVSR